MTGSVVPDGRWRHGRHPSPWRPRAACGLAPQAVGVRPTNHRGHVPNAGVRAVAGRSLARPSPNRVPGRDRWHRNTRRTGTGLPRNRGTDQSAAAGSSATQGSDARPGSGDIARMIGLGLIDADASGRSSVVSARAPRRPRWPAGCSRGRLVRRMQRSGCAHRAVGDAGARLGAQEPGPTGRPPRSESSVLAGPSRLLLFLPRAPAWAHPEDDPDADGVEEADDNCPEVAGTSRRMRTGMVCRRCVRLHGRGCRWFRRCEPPASICDADCDDADPAVPGNTEIWYDGSTGLRWQFRWGCRR